jgi:hypothetical protein
MTTKRTSLAALLALGLPAGGAAGAAAQDDSTNGIGQDHFTATTGEPADVVGPEEQRSEMEWGIDGLEYIDVPFEATDPRISGLLTAVHNGRGGITTNGQATVENRAVRITNPHGAWSGTATTILTFEGDEPVLNHSLAVLEGEGFYESLTAYFIVEPDGEGGELTHGVIMSVDQPPQPELIPAQQLRAATRPAVASGDAGAGFFVPLRGQSCAAGVGGSGKSVGGSGRITPRMSGPPVSVMKSYVT